MRFKDNIDIREALTFDDISLTPTYSDIVTRSDCDLSVDLGAGVILSTPVVASPMKAVCGAEMALAIGKLGGIGIIHRFCTLEEQVEMVKSVRDRLYVWRQGRGEESKIIGSGTMLTTDPIGAAIGVSDYEYRVRAAALIAAGANVINLDVAHGHHILSKVAISYLKRAFPDVHIMSGAVCTKEAIYDLSEWGATSVRCGVGSGSACETRIRTGIGIPQATAIIECAEAADAEGLTIIADGGLRAVGDVAKALALGSNAVMLGSILSGAKETPGEIMKEGVWPNERLYKVYMGSASFAAKMDRNEKTKNIEGTSMRVPYKGKVKRVVNDINDGVRSSMSYVGARDISQYQHNAKFVKTTQSGIVEASPHGVSKSNA